MKYDVFNDNVIRTMHEIYNFNKRGIYFKLPIFVTRFALNLFYEQFISINVCMNWIFVYKAHLKIEMK